MVRSVVHIVVFLLLCAGMTCAKSAHAAGKPHGGRAHVQTRAAVSRPQKSKYISPKYVAKSHASTTRARFSDFSSYSRVNTPSLLEPTSINLTSSGDLQLSSMPAFSTVFDENLAGVTSQRDIVVYTLRPELQQFTTSLVRSTRAPHIAVVAMDPHTGKILSMYGRSSSLGNAALHSGYPAASVFKVVTMTAALEKGAIEPESPVRFRGGTYTLNEWNYKPDPRKDRRVMSVTEALGRSCNPVFGRIALQYLTPEGLRSRASAFGFNTPLRFEVPLAPSSAEIPEEDLGLSLTGAGFGKVTLSPVHAAALVSGVANNGLMPKPNIVERVLHSSGATVYRAQPTYLKRVASASTAHSVLRMMESTTTIGTSRKEFMRRDRKFAGIRVAAKTGTLSGANPKGVNNWFVAAAPIDNPKIAVAVIVVNPSGISSKASHLGRLVIEKYLGSLDEV